MPQKSRIPLVFFGTPEIAAYALEKLMENFDIVAAVTQREKAAGRGKSLQLSPVKIFAQGKIQNIFQPRHIQNIKQDMQALKADMGVVYAFSYIFPKSILKIFPFGILNIHPSLLPKYRGPSPIQTALLYGEKETGVTIIHLDEKTDHGPILAQEKTKINPQETSSDLSWRLTAMGCDLLIKTIPKFLHGEIKPREQNHAQATYTKKIKKEDGRIYWNINAEDILNRYRAFQPWPGLYTCINTKRLKILKLLPIQEQGIPGDVFQTQDKKMAVYCKDGAILLEEVQLEGKRAMSSDEFLRGNYSVIGKNLSFSAGKSSP